MLRLDLVGRVLDTDAVDVEIGTLIGRSDLIAIRKIGHCWALDTSQQITELM